jgi:hypothetical protein
MKKQCLSIFAVLVVTFMLIPGEAKTPKKKADLIFEGTVLQMSPPVPPTGVLTHYRLVKYRVETVCKGKYSNKEILVDHFSLTGKELEGIKQGDRVFVAVDKAKDIPVRTEFQGLREPGDTVKIFYVGGGVAPPDTLSGSCSDKAISGLRLNVQRIYDRH